jgi:hypothetical protein
MERSDVYRSRKQGNLARRLLPKYLLARTNKVFNRKDVIEKKNLALTLLVDCSVSMKPYFLDVIKTLELFGITLERLNIPFEIVCYNSQFSNEAIDVVTPGIYATNVENLYTFTYKSFNQKFSSVRLIRRGQVRSFFEDSPGSTPSSSALAYAALKLLSKTGVDKRFIIHITDGEPNDRIIGMSSLVFFRKLVVLLTNDPDMFVFGIGIGDVSDHLGYLYKDTFFEDAGTASNLPNKTFSTLQKILKRFYV